MSPPNVKVSETVLTGFEPLQGLDAFGGTFGGLAAIGGLEVGARATRCRPTSRGRE